MRWYVEIEPAIQMAFLDTAGVPHEQGKIAESAEAPYSSAEVVAKAAEAIVAHYGDDGKHYLPTIATYNAAAWPGIGGLL